MSILGSKVRAICSFFTASRNPSVSDCGVFRCADNDKVNVQKCSPIEYAYSIFIHILVDRIKLFYNLSIGFFSDSNSYILYNKKPGITYKEQNCPQFDIDNEMD